MKTQTKIVGLIKKSELDEKLAQYAQLTDSIKAMEAEKAKLKAALVKSYFESNSVYQSKDGSIAASYLSQMRTQFENENFKDAHPDLYEKFSHKQEIHIFTVKLI